MAQIIFISQPVIQHPGSVANLAAFGSACPMLVAALRGARHPKIRSEKADTLIGNGILAAE
jgi:hypothetical protein